MEIGSDRMAESPREPKSQVMRLLLASNAKIEYLRRGPAQGKLIREKRRRVKKVGVLLALPVGSEIVIGWSLCHRTLDEFDTETAVELARDRALVWKDRETRLSWKGGEVPHSIQGELVDFAGKMRMYYKGKAFPTWVSQLELDYAKRMDCSTAGG